MAGRRREHAQEKPCKYYLAGEDRAGEARGQVRPAHLVLRSSQRRLAGRTGRSLHRYTRALSTRNWRDSCGRDYIGKGQREPMFRG